MGESRLSQVSCQQRHTGKFSGNRTEKEPANPFRGQLALFVHRALSCNAPLCQRRNDERRRSAHSSERVPLLNFRSAHTHRRYMSQPQIRNRAMITHIGVSEV